MMRIVRAGALATAALAVTAAAATTTTTTTETFDGTLDQATFRIGTYDAILGFGGNPGSYLRNPTEDAAELTIAGLPSATMFVGDYRAMGVTSLGIDIDIFSVGFSVDGRPVSLDLYSDMGTPDDTSDDCDAVYVGSKNVPKPGTGWKTFDFRVKSDNTTLPPGWELSGVCGNLSEDAAWNDVITNVDRVSFLFGEPGFFYFFQIWNLGIDNVRITTSSH
jgi:hypothetical protein